MSHEHEYEQSTLSRAHRVCKKKKLDKPGLFREILKREKERSRLE